MAIWSRLGESAGFGQRDAVLEDRGLPVPGEVGGRLAGARGGVEIGREAARRLRLAEQLARVGLADRDVAGRQVGQHGGARQRPLPARRGRHPQILADLGVNDEIRRRSSAANRRSGPNGTSAAAEQDLLVLGAVAGGEMATLVELAVVRQVDLRHDAEQPAAVDRHRAIVEAAVVPERRANEDQRQQVGRGCARRVAIACFDGVEQRVLQQQIVDRVAGHAEFREQREGNALVVAAPDGMQDRARVGARIGDRGLRRTSRNADETVRINRAEIHRHCLLQRCSGEGQGIKHRRSGVTVSLSGLG